MRLGSMAWLAGDCFPCSSSDVPARHTPGSSETSATSARRRASRGELQGVTRVSAGVASQATSMAWSSGHPHMQPCQILDIWLT